MTEKFPSKMVKYSIIYYFSYVFYLISIIITKFAILNTTLSYKILSNIIKNKLGWFYFIYPLNYRKLLFKISKRPM